MSYSSVDARQQVLDDLAAATEQLTRAVADLGEAYERMDERSADRLEQSLFRPLQAAYGAAKRTHAEFAARYGIATRALEELPVSLPAAPEQTIRRAADAIERADRAIAALQDSMLPVEVGDVELRAGLARTRELLTPLPARAQAMIRTLGR